MGRRFRQGWSVSWRRSSVASMLCSSLREPSWPSPQKANKLKQKRPRSRTLQAVHNNILDDLVYPAEIVGKRIRIKLDGTRLFKCHLDKNQQTNIEHKVETFSSIYKKLTGKEVNFEFPEAYL